MSVFPPAASRRHYTVPLPNGRLLELTERTLIMGILNVTPDSFADAHRLTTADGAVRAGLDLIAAGADLLDVGGESTRPGAASVEPDEECARVVPVIARLARETDVPLSVDTTKATVAKAALEAGASIVNDISALRYDPDLASVVAQFSAGIVLMHIRGRPSDMYAQATYEHVVEEVASELSEAVDRAARAGVPRECLILDPGIGFAKRAAHSLEILARLNAPALVALDRPLLVGPSRKSFLEAALGPRPVAEREWGTAAAVAAATLGGAHIVRVHAVDQMCQVVRVADAIRRFRAPKDEE